MNFCVAVEATERLDRFLADQLQLSRTHAARLIGEKAVTVGGKVARASRVMARGDLVEITFPEHVQARQLAPADITLEVVHEDSHLAVIDKPAGLVVHPAPGHWNDTLVNALVARGTTLSGGAAGRPGIVHRLDRDTSGLIIVAKDDLTHRRLGALIAARRVSRVYAAIVWGHLDHDMVTIEAPLARHPRDRKRMAVVADGRAARTDAFQIARLGSVSLLRLELHSGRTHQIRVHLESIGHPIVGDPVYAGGGAKRISGSDHLAARKLEALAPRQALHATLLAFRHPITAEPLRVASPWPADLWPLLQAALGADTLPDAGRALDDLGFFARDE